MASSGPLNRPPGGEILRSNVDQVAPDQDAHGAKRPRASVLPFVLGALLFFVLGAGVAILWTTTQLRPQQMASASAAATAISRPTAPAVANPALNSQAATGPLSPVNGISCDALEGTIVHIHVHLAIFINGEEQQIPFGVGIGQPWTVSDSDEGPFVDDGSCFYWIHTHTEDGIIHIESPVRRRFTLADFFAIWQVPLSATQVGPAQGPVIAYVNGQRSDTNPPDIPLLPHEQIQLDVGGDVPPYQFAFPPGD